MRAYFDASALAAIILQDSSAAAVISWSEKVDARPVVSDFGRGEVASAVSIRVRSRRMTIDQAEVVLAETDRRLARWEQQNVVSDDIRWATGLVRRFDLPLRLPDAIHVAVAQRIGLTLVTTDEDQFRAASSIGAPAVNPTQA